jgi:glutaredoxin 2
MLAQKKAAKKSENR